MVISTWLGSTKINPEPLPQLIRILFYYHHGTQDT